MAAASVRAWSTPYLRELGALLLPESCIGCSTGTRRVCESCRAALASEVRCQPHHGELVWHGPEFAGAVASLLRQFKASGDREILLLAANELREIVAVAARESESELLLVPPSRRAAYRERGFDPLQLMCRAAGLHVHRPFGFRRGVLDQRGLSANERRANVAAALYLRSPLPSGARIGLIDDITTTGATLDAMARCVTDAGGVVAARMVLAVTPRRKPLAPQERGE